MSTHVGNKRKSPILGSVFANNSEFDMMDVDDPGILESINSAVAENRTHVPSPISLGKKPTATLGTVVDVIPQDIQSIVPVLVIDTNFLLSHLAIIEELRSLHHQYEYYIVIPWIVIQELDGLKSASDRSRLNNDRGKSNVNVLARLSINWIYRQLAGNDDAVIGQKLTEIIDLNLNGDDAILDCCRFFQERRNALTVILSNDKNLCAKALIHGIKTVTYQKGMTARQIAETVKNESLRLKIEDQERQQPESALVVVDDDAMDIDTSLDFVSYAEDKGPETATTAQEPTEIAATNKAAAGYKVTVNTRGEVPEPKLKETVTPTKLKTDQFVQVADYIEETIVTNIVICIDHHMHASYDGDEELNYFGYSKESLVDYYTIEELLRRFKISVFTTFIPRAVFSQLKSVTGVPLSKDQLKWYADIWGSVWLYLSKDVQDTKSVQNIVTDLKSYVETNTQ